MIVLIIVISAPVVRFLNFLRERNRFLRNEAANLANPQNADARLQLARIYCRRGRYRKALPYVEEAMKVAEENPLYDEIPPSFHRLHGDILFGMRRYAKAEEAFNETLQLGKDVEFGEIYLRLGRCALRQRKYEDALQWFQRSVKERSSYLETYFRIAQAAAKLGRRDEIRKAKEDFSRVAANLPKFVKQSPFKWRLAFVTFPFSRRLI